MTGKKAETMELDIHNIDNLIQQLQDAKATALLQGGDSFNRFGRRLGGMPHNYRSLDER